jgi:predicted amidohydrolase
MRQTVRAGALSTGAAGNALSPMLDAAESGVERLAAQGAELIVLPELFALPYVAGDKPEHWRHLAEPLDGPTANWAGALARRLGVDLVFGMALERNGTLPVNAALLARRNGRVSVAAEKMRLPPRSGKDRFGEEDHFSPGAPEIRAVKIGTIRVTVLICYDRRFPEHWLQAARVGADLVAVIVGGPAPGDPDGYFLAELQTHARANGIYALAASRTGVETILGFPVSHDGETVAVGPDGAVISRRRDDGTAIVDIDPGRVADARANQAERRRPSIRTSTSSQFSTSGQ